eukprot:TRINITY_DN7749_c0_g2_i1.p1 TRINITY_DN7749_c0_g2~~TRINITY_DN7749_c0_g2_i1.p1  ORF type:complete len:613 (-),score=67.91 TRINITY_DN7749_c0_g2_i1:215-2053(-)
MSSVPSSTDLLVFCALASECEAARKVFEPESAPAPASSSTPGGAAAGGVANRNRFVQPNGIVVYHGSFLNENGEELQVKFISASEMGARTTASMLPGLLDTFKPRWVAMTGICAGFPDKCNLGDVVVATRAVDLTQGGKETSDGVQVGAQHPEPSMPMRNWITQIERDATWHKFRKLLHPDDVSVDAPLPAYWLAMFLLAAREGSVEALKPAEIKNQLTAQRYLYSDSSLLRAFKYCNQKKWLVNGSITADETKELEIARDRCGYPFGDFPPKPTAARVLSGVVVTTPNVRTDLAGKYEDLKRSVGERNLIALDTEIAAFLQVAKDYQDLHHDHHIEFLALKGVCDFGDDLKDDVFHHGAAINSAAVLLLLARQHLRPDMSELASAASVAPPAAALVVPAAPDLVQRWEDAMKTLKNDHDHGILIEQCREARTWNPRFPNSMRNEYGHPFPYRSLPLGSDGVAIALVKANWMTAKLRQSFLSVCQSLALLWDHISRDEFNSALKAHVSSYPPPDSVAFFQQLVGLLVTTPYVIMAYHLNGWFCLPRDFTADLRHSFARVEFTLLDYAANFVSHKPAYDLAEWLAKVCRSGRVSEAARLWSKTQNARGLLQFD